jgi:hypothetical protein
MQNLTPGQREILQQLCNQVNDDDLADGNFVVMGRGAGIARSLRIPYRTWKRFWRLAHDLNLVEHVGGVGVRLKGPEGPVWPVANGAKLAPLAPANGAKLAPFAPSHNKDRAGAQADRLIEGKRDHSFNPEEAGPVISALVAAGVLSEVVIVNALAKRQVDGVWPLELPEAQAVVRIIVADGFWNHQKIKSRPAMMTKLLVRGYSMFKPTPAQGELFPNHRRPISGREDDQEKQARQGKVKELFDALTADGRIGKVYDEAPGESIARRWKDEAAHGKYDPDFVRAMRSM